MDFIGEIKKIEKQIENAAGDLANQVVDELQAAKKQIEKEMQRMMLKTEVEFKSIDIIKEDTYALQKKHRDISRFTNKYKRYSIRTREKFRK
ncbi:hypothetical protein ICQ_05795 [Bacillus toyonensis]|nr:hypothetical protein ICQ_05795 [Bacillus toyonensis]